MPHRLTGGWHVKIGFVGLGKMGARMVERLSSRGHQVVAFDLSADARREASERGAIVATSLHELVNRLSRPRCVWIMVPAGAATEETISSLDRFLEGGDIVIDGGNSYYKDTMRRAEKLRAKDMFLLDAGTSGGVRGLREGYCLMVGGDAGAYRTAEPVFAALSSEGGYARVGGSGAGHFVKMVHNGIEYALLEAYAEGFELMREKEEFSLDLPLIARLWNRGSVIRSWLLELAALALGENPDLDGVGGYVEDSGEGRWTVEEAVETGVPIPLIALSLFARFRSRRKDPFGARLIAALRREFGGHAVKRE